MTDPERTEPGDEIGEASVEQIAAIIARFCPDCSPEDILRHVHEILAPKQRPGETG